MRIFLSSMVLAAIVIGPAKADRLVTEAERARLVAAVAAQGCSSARWNGMKTIRNSKWTTPDAATGESTI
jgi:hypothetical protein